MNSKKKARTSLHSTSNPSYSQDINTPSGSSKQNLLTSCRRIGLNRKRIKTSPITTDSVKKKNIFVEEDLKKITESILAENKRNSDDIQVESKTKSDLKKEEAIEPIPKIGSKKKAVKTKRKRIIESEDDEISHDFCSTESPNLSATKMEKPKVPDKMNIESGNKLIQTIPISIKLTRCDLTSLKLNSEKKNVDATENVAAADNFHVIENVGIVENDNILEDINENKENVPDVQNKYVEESCERAEISKEIIEQPPIEDVDETNTQNTEETSVSERTIPENNSLEEHSDSSDFLPSVSRHKKKKIRTTKQRNISKPSPQKDSPLITKRVSTNNTPRYSDSDDDFIPTPVRNNSMKSENNSQSSEKSEKVKKKKMMKLKKPVEDELNKTESDDNQQRDDNQQPSDSLELPKNQTMIIEHLMNNLDSVAQELQKIAEDKENHKIELSKSQKISVIETTRLQNKDDTPKILNIDKENELTNAKNSEEPENDMDESLENEESDSSDMKDSDVEKFDEFINQLSDSDFDESESPLEDDLHEMSVEQLADELKSLKDIVKKKQEKCQTLKRIKVYKETHDIKKLHELTLRIRKGSQNALVDLIARMKQQSDTPFTIATFLEFIKIPNELVGYNSQDDEFI